MKCFRNVCAREVAGNLRVTGWKDEHDSNYLAELRAPTWAAEMSAKLEVPPAASFSRRFRMGECFGFSSYEIIIFGIS